MDSMLEAFREQKKISVRFAFEIVMGALAALKSEATLVDVDVPTGVPSCAVRANFPVRNEAPCRHASTKLPLMSQHQPSCRRC